MRLALGAGRGRLIRQTLTESLVLATAGGIVGLVLSIWVGDLLLSVMPFESCHALALDRARPARRAVHGRPRAGDGDRVRARSRRCKASRPQLNRTLREEAGSLSGGAHHARFRKGLVVAQVALSMLLVAGAGLFARSLYNLKTLDTGYRDRQPDHVPRRSGAQRLRPDAASSASTISCCEDIGRIPRRAVGVGGAGRGADRRRQQPHDPGAGLQAEARREHEPVDQRDRAGLFPHDGHAAA